MNWKFKIGDKVKCELTVVRSVGSQPGDTYTVVGTGPKFPEGDDKPWYALRHDTLGEGEHLRHYRDAYEHELVAA